MMKNATNLNRKRKEKMKNKRKEKKKKRKKKSQNHPARRSIQSNIKKALLHTEGEKRHKITRLW